MPRDLAQTWDAYEAVLFDLDGVVTPTAQVHMVAWAEMFNDWLDGLRESGTAGPDADLSPYTEVDYFAHVDGKPRYDGVRDLAAARGIDLPQGSPDDAPAVESVCGLGNRKNDAFNAVLERDGVTAYPGSVALLDHLRDLGTPLAIVSSSANAAAVLESAGLLDRFAFVMSGAVATERDLPGKPAPDTFVAAAREVGAAVAASVVLEDAVSGVRAGAAGGFPVVIGVDRGVGADALRDAGATHVVDDLAELVPADDGSGGGAS